MVDAGFGKTIDRDSDALRWALGTPDVVGSSADWVAVPVAGQRAVVLSAGQGQAAQITMPDGLGAKTQAETVQLTFNGSATYQGKLICRELEWYDIDAATPGVSRFVVVNGPDLAAVPSGPPALSSFGLVRRPGEKYQMPLWYAVVDQATNTVRLWDLRRISELAPKTTARGSAEIAFNGDSVGPAGSKTVGSLTVQGPFVRGQVVRVFVQLHIAQSGGGNVAGGMTASVAGVDMDTRRWHNHGRAGMMWPAFEDEMILTADAQSVTVALKVTSDQLSANAVEIWDGTIRAQVR